MNDSVVLETSHLLNNDEIAQSDDNTSKASSGSSSRGPSRFVLLVTSFLLLATSVLNSVYFKKMTNSMQNYAWFLTQQSTVVYVPVFFFLVFMNWSKITPDMRNFPKVSFFIMGAYDAIAGLLSMLGGVHVSGSIQALLSNAIIPFTMILSVFMLNQSFSTYQIIGAIVIMVGIGAAMLPSFGNDSNSSSSVVFIAMFVLSNIPSALSSVYKDKAFNNIEMDVNYLQAWVALWQQIFGFILIPFNTLDMLGADKIEFQEMGTAFMNGQWCFAGYNSVIPPKCNPGEGDFLLMGDDFVKAYGQLDRRTRATVLAAQPMCDHCPGAWVPVVVYLCVNMLYNYFMIVIIRQSGSSWLYVLSTLRLPLVQLAFSIPSINNPPDTFGMTELVGLTAILIGLALYKYGDAEEGGAILAHVQGSIAMPHMQVVKEIQKQSLQLHPKSAHTLRLRYYTKLYGSMNSTNVKKQLNIPVDDDEEEDKTRVPHFSRRQSYTMSLPDLHQQQSQAFPVHPYTTSERSSERGRMPAFSTRSSRPSTPVTMRRDSFTPTSPLDKVYTDHSSTHKVASLKLPRASPLFHTKSTGSPILSSLSPSVGKRSGLASLRAKPLSLDGQVTPSIHVSSSTPSSRSFVVQTGATETTENNKETS